MLCFMEASPPRRPFSSAANIKTKRTLHFIQAFLCRHPADIRGPLVAFSCGLRSPRLSLCVPSQDEEKWPDGSGWMSCRVFILKWRAQLGQNKQTENGWCVAVMLLPVCWFKDCSCKKKVSDRLQSTTIRKKQPANQRHHQDNLDFSMTHHKATVCLGGFSHKIQKDLREQEVIFQQPFPAGTYASSLITNESYQQK